MGRADIKLGYSCNNECIHCVISDFKDKVAREGLPEDIPEQDYKKELMDSRQRADRVVFTGGEPTIRKELPELLAFARDIGFSITMQTNGRRLSDPNFASVLCSIAPIDFCIAIHGPNREIHDRITQRKGSFYETVQGIRNVMELRKGSGRLSGKLVISKVNAPYLVETVRFMISLGFTSVNLTFPHACGNARKFFYEVVPRYTEIKEQVLNAIEVCLLGNVSIDTETIPFCFLPNVEHLAVENRIIPDEYTELKQYGNDEKVLDWNKVRLEIKQKFPQCSECRFDGVCEGPWIEYPQFYGNDEFIPVKGERVADPGEILRGAHIPPGGISAGFALEIDNCMFV